jgi:ribosomal protein S18 acetylase RimI-like enzyme
MNPIIVTADLEQLHELAPLFDAYRVFYEQPSDLPRATAFLRERLTQHDSVIFMVYLNDQALGFTQLFPSFSSVSTQRIWILNDLYIVPDVRGQRVGERLIERAVQLARETQAKGIQLETAHSNLAGQRLYERMGFTREDLAFRTYFLAV